MSITPDAIGHSVSWLFIRCALADLSRLAYIKNSSYLCTRKIETKSKIKKLFTLFRALAASVGTLFAANGKCGANLTWDFTDGVLTISGSGDMTHWEWEEEIPWYSYHESITTVIIGDSVTSIGYMAFYNCTGLTSVTIGNSVTGIGEISFFACTGLTSVTCKAVVPPAADMIHLQRWKNPFRFMFRKTA